MRQRATMSKEGEEALNAVNRIAKLRLQQTVQRMNDLPDVSGNDSPTLARLSRTTANEIKFAGGVSAATSLETIGYIRRLEGKLRAARVQDFCADCGDADIVDTCPYCYQSFCAGCVEKDEFCCEGETAPLVTPSGVSETGRRGGREA